MKNLILASIILILATTTGYAGDRFAQRAEEEYLPPVEEEIAVPEDETFDPSVELEIDYWGGR